MKIDFWLKPGSMEARTNEWTIRCLCGKDFTPRTTMFAHQTFSCPRCQKEYRADWNAPKVEVAE